MQREAGETPNSGTSNQSSSGRRYVDGRNMTPEQVQKALRDKSIVATVYPEQLGFL